MTKNIKSSQIALPLVTPATLGGASKVSVPAPKIDEQHAWVMARWIEISIPCWRRILQESIQEGTKRREVFARYMLGGVLQDPDYKAPWQDPGKFKVEPESKEELVDGEV